MRVWITRTRPGADRTAAALAVHGIESVIAPILLVRPLEVSIDLEGFDALAFTSPNGVEAFARLSPERGLPAFAVGDTTAEALRRIGFDRVDTADGDIEALARLLSKERPGRILGLGPTEPAGDLTALAADVPVETRAIYETVASDAIAPSDGSFNAVLIHSAKAARALAASGLDLSGVAIFALSEACAAPLRARPVKSIAVSPFPDDASLVRLAKDVLSEAP